MMEGVNESRGWIRDRSMMTAQEQQQQQELDRRLVFGRDKYRIAVFGSSNAWGAGADSRFDAYPYVLSPTVHNYAAFSAGPNYYSVCTETELGDQETFDVIIIDYWLRAAEGVVELALRLRERYPHAIIIFLTVWTPNHYRRGGTQSIAKWKEIAGLKHQTNLTVLANALRADTAEWSIPPHTQANAIIQEAIHKVGGIGFSLPKNDTAKKTLLHSLPYFDRHHHMHVSSKGHAVIAQHLLKIIHAHVPKHDTGAMLSRNSQDHGTWGRGDNCHLWFTTGGIDYDYDRHHIHMVEYDPVRGKFALEVDTVGGWIHVKNPFADERTAFFSFLATRQHVYPFTEIAYHNRTRLTTFNPVTDHNNNNNAHIIRTFAVGKIPPGLTHMKITPQEVTTLKFRLVGVSLTNERSTPHEFGFGPEFNQ